MKPKHPKYVTVDEYIEYIKNLIKGRINYEIETQNSKKILVDLTFLFIPVDNINLDEKFMESILSEYKDIGWNYEVFYFSSFVWRHQITLMSI